MALTANHRALCEVIETLSLGLDVASNPSITHQISGISGVLNASSTPPGSQVFSDRRTLTAGADTLDLTALTNSIGAALDLTGLKVQLLLIKGATTNTGDIVVATGASNGYPGITGTVPDGGYMLLFGNDGYADVAAADAEIDISSTDLDAIYDVIIVAG